MARVGIDRPADAADGRLNVHRIAECVRRLVTPPDIAFSVEQTDGGGLFLVGVKLLRKGRVQADTPVGHLVGAGPADLLRAVEEVAGDLGRQEVRLLNSRWPPVELGRIELSPDSSIVAG